MALLGVTVYNTGSRQRQVSGSNEHKTLPGLVIGAVFVCFFVFRLKLAIISCVNESNAGSLFYLVIITCHFLLRVCMCVLIR
jgi:hypothetical protein